MTVSVPKLPATATLFVLVLKASLLPPTVTALVAGTSRPQLYVLVRDFYVPDGTLPDNAATPSVGAVSAMVTVTSCFVALPLASFTLKLYV